MEKGSRNFRILGITISAFIILNATDVVADYATHVPQFLLEGSGDYQPIGTYSTLGGLGGGLQPVVAAKMLSKIDAAQGMDFSKLSTRGLTTRGLREIKIFANASPSVVFIVTKGSIGSGSLVDKDGLLITNLHVVGANKQVAIAFKPPIRGAKISKKDIYAARVIGTDKLRDLALLKITSYPSHVQPIRLGSIKTLQVGADVHAIGHPLGYKWTYTKGFVSQIANNREWRIKSGVAHKANIIQTQTPIAPGSSGGPLLDDDGKLIGVNTYIIEGEQINFAVSVEHVASLLQTYKGQNQPAKWKTAPKKKCKLTTLFDGYDKANPKYSRIVRFDRNCDGKVDTAKLIPKSKKTPIFIIMDKDFDGKIDTKIVDSDRDGRWNISYYDTNADGIYDLIGHHPDGKITASRFSEYVPKS